MVQKNLVVVLGYDPTGMRGGLKPKTVWEDRLNKGLELYRALENANFMITGGGEYNGESEALLMKEFAEEKFDTTGIEILLEENATNTAENIENVKTIAEDYETIFLVSSRDHTPYVQKLATGKISNAFTVSSDKMTLRNRFWHAFNLIRKGKI